MKKLIGCIAITIFIVVMIYAQSTTSPVGGQGYGNWGSPIYAIWSDSAGWSIYADSARIAVTSITSNKADSLAKRGGYVPGDSFLVCYGDTFSWLIGDSIFIEGIYGYDLAVAGAAWRIMNNVAGDTTEFYSADHIWINGISLTVTGNVTADTFFGVYGAVGNCQVVYAESLYGCSDIVANANLEVVDTLKAESGRSTTLVVAANNSSAMSKYQADYVCDSIDDQVEIQEALDSLSNFERGKIILLEGVYCFSNCISPDTGQEIEILGKIIMANSVSSILTSDAASGQADVVVFDASSFFVGQWVAIADTTTVVHYGKNTGEAGTILSISSNTLTLSTNLANAYTTNDSAYVASVPSAILIDSKSRVYIHGNGEIDGNKANQSTINPAVLGGVSEETRSGSGISIKDSKYCRVEDLYIHDCNLHNIALKNADHVTINHTELAACNDKNLLVFNSDSIRITNNYARNSVNEDGIILYCNCDYAWLAHNVTKTNARYNILVQYSNYVTSVGDVSLDPKQYSMYYRGKLTDTTKYCQIISPTIDGGGGSASGSTYGLSLWYIQDCIVIGGIVHSCSVNVILADTLRVQILGLQGYDNYLENNLFVQDTLKVDFIAADDSNEVTFTSPLTLDTLDAQHVVADGFVQTDSTQSNHFVLVGDQVLWTTFADTAAKYVGDTATVLRSNMSDSSRTASGDSIATALRHDGSVALTGNWVAGDFDITGLETIEADTFFTTGVGMFTDGGADSARIWDDGDTTYFDSDNPIKIGGASLVVGTNGLVTIDSLVARTSAWKYCKYMDAINLAHGGSGATEVTPDANTQGGFNMDADGEYCYFNGSICNNWDEASDLKICVIWECDVDNTAGGATDTVEFDLLVYLKGNGETPNKTQTLSSRVEVGQSAQYKQFRSFIYIDYDSGTDPVEPGDVLAMRLNFDVTNSDITDVIVNFLKFSYQTNVPQLKNY